MCVVYSIGNSRSPLMADQSEITVIIIYLLADVFIQSNYLITLQNGTEGFQVASQNYFTVDDLDMKVQLEENYSIEKFKSLRSKVWGFSKVMERYMCFQKYMFAICAHRCLNSQIRLQSFIIKYTPTQNTQQNTFSIVGTIFQQTLISLVLHY